MSRNIRHVIGAVIVIASEHKLDRQSQERLAQIAYDSVYAAPEIMWEHWQDLAVFLQRHYSDNKPMIRAFGGDDDVHPYLKHLPVEWRFLASEDDCAVSKGAMLIIRGRDAV